MNSLIRTYKTAPLYVLMFAVAVLTPSRTFGVFPPPDGGYPNGNTAEGSAALFSLTTGGFNTAVGFFSLKSDATNSFNTAVGAGTLLSNIADQNTAIGAAALLSNTNGLNNTAGGAFALFSNTEGDSNTAIGTNAMQSNITGNDNTAVGRDALRTSTQGNANTATGSAALAVNAGGANTANGAFALERNTTGTNNSGIGAATLLFNTTGGFNTAIGSGALIDNAVGNDNTGIGANALQNATGNGNIGLGKDSGVNITNANGVICIGSLPAANVGNTCFIDHIRGKTTINNNAIAVVVDPDGQLGTTSSSRRFKKEIQPMEHASEAILALKPVTFHYKSDSTNRPEFGLIAEEVADVNPDLVVRDKSGEIYTVRYDAVNAMLLNEFLKAHKRMQDLEARDAQQQKQIETLTKQLKEQAAQIQKVSAQHELGEPAPEVASNDS